MSRLEPERSTKGFLQDSGWKFLVIFLSNFYTFLDLSLEAVKNGLLVKQEAVEKPQF